MRYGYRPRRLCLYGRGLWATLNLPRDTQLYCVGLDCHFRLTEETKERLRSDAVVFMNTVEGNVPVAFGDTAQDTALGYSFEDLQETL